jgi:hypothetical protein
MFDTDLLN